MTAQLNIPTLRFPGFEGEWKFKRLSDFIYFKAGYAFKSEKMSSIKKQYQLIKMSNVYNNELRLDRSPSYWESIDKNSENALLQKGDVVLTLTGTVGKRDFGYSTQINKDNKFLLNQRLVLLRYIEQKSDSNFILETIRGIRFLESFFNEAKGGTGNQANVSIEDLKSLLLPFPTLPEQQKIASFLSKVDKKLTQLKKKKELLEQYKKGMMQKIFSQEIRFKIENEAGELVEAPDWEEKQLGDIYTFIPTNSFSRDCLNYDTGEIKNIHYGDIHTKFSTLFDIERETVPFINENVNLKKIDTKQYCLASDLLFADASEDYADIGKGIEIVNTNGQMLLGGLHTIHARQKSDVFAIGFGGYLIKSEKFRFQMMKIAQGAKVLGISSTKLSELIVPVPIKEEQTKIANFLSSIDQKIAHTQTQIEKAEQWKKGLLQQLFV